MAKVTKIEFDYSGFNAYRNSPEVKRELEQRANAIATAAGEGFEAELKSNPSRAFAVVRAATPEAMRAEAQAKVLTHAIDAGR